MAPVSNVTLHIISQFVTSLVMLAWIFVLVAGYHVAVKMVDTMEWSAQLDQMQYVLNADILFFTVSSVITSAKIILRVAVEAQLSEHSRKDV